MPRHRSIGHLVVVILVFIGFLRVVDWCNSLSKWDAKHAGFEDVFGMKLSDYNNAGFKRFSEGFNTCKVDRNLEITIEIPITVHIVGSRDKFKWSKAAAFGSPVAGYATKQNEIYVFGRYYRGKIVVNQAILGHETNHLLNFRDSRIADPDKLE